MRYLFRRNSLVVIDKIINSAQAHNRPLCSITLAASSNPDNGVATSLCASLRRGLNWDAMSRKFDSVRLTDAIIEQVMLEFKQPPDAKRALSFFHWVAHTNKNRPPPQHHHSLRTYCIAIHILARARLTNDAKALIDSVLQSRDSALEEDSNTAVVDCLLDTYKVTDSCPFVFDLLVRSYSKLRMIETAFMVCQYVEGHGFFLNLNSFNALLHVIQNSYCERQSDLIWKVYGHMVERRVYGKTTTMQIMVSSLCKDGELQKYLDVTTRMHGKKCAPAVVVNTSLVMRMLREGKLEQAMVMLKRLLQKNLILDTISYSLIVYAKVKDGWLDSARQVYDEMLRRGFSPNSFVYTTFIGSYCEEGMLEEASRLFEEMITLGIIPYDETYNFLILGYAKLGKSDSSMRYCEEMNKRGMLPSTMAFNEMVRSLCEDGYMTQANDILTLVIDNGFSPDEITYSHLINGYSKEGNVQQVLKLYHEMKYRFLSPGLLSFTPIIRVLCEHGMINDAEKFLSIMRDHSVDPNVSIFEFLIASHREKGNEERACQLYNEMVEMGIVC